MTRANPGGRGETGFVTRPRCRSRRHLGLHAVQHARVWPARKTFNRWRRSSGTAAVFALSMVLMTTRRGAPDHIASALSTSSARKLTVERGPDAAQSSPDLTWQRTVGRCRAARRSCFHKGKVPLPFGHATQGSSESGQSSLRPDDGPRASDDPPPEHLPISRRHRDGRHGLRGRGRFSCVAFRCRDAGAHPNLADPLPLRRPGSRSSTWKKRIAAV